MKSSRKTGLFSVNAYKAEMIWLDTQHIFCLLKYIFKMVAENRPWIEASLNVFYMIFVLPFPQMDDLINWALLILSRILPFASPLHGWRH